MNQIPRKEVKISRALGSFKGSKLDDGLVLDPGTVIDADDARNPNRNRPAPQPAAAIDPDVLPITQLPAGSNPRRISRLVTGGKPRPAAQRQIAVVSSVPRLPATQSQIPPAPGRKDDGTEIIVQLGRIGDILNILPVCHESFRETGRKARLMVAAEFASLLDGCSYVQPIIFNGKYGELDRAVAEAKRFSPHVKVPQVYFAGKEFPRKHENYQRDAWARIGRGHRFEQLSLIFDRRSPQREQSLLSNYTGAKPIVAVALDAISVPFPHKARVIEALQKDFPDFEVLDLNSIQAERFYDMLGLIDAAHVLVACDSAIQHLAQASSTPVVAFRCNDSWRASARRANHILNRRYSDIDMKEVSAAIKGLDLRKVIDNTANTYRKLIHVVPVAYEDGAVQRAIRASLAWNDKFEHKRGNYERLVLDTSDSRSSLKIGDERATPYVLDLIEAAMKKTTHLDDAVVFSNSDIGIVDGAENKLRTLLLAKGAAFAYRFTHTNVAPEGYIGNVSGYWDGGLDLFAFTRRWLLTHASKLPDLLIGRTGWDLVFRDVIKKTGGGELFGCIWHEKHDSWWNQNLNTPGNQYNIERLKKYHAENDITRPYDR